MLLTGSSVGSGLGTAAGAFFGPVGAGVGGALGGMVGSAFDKAPSAPLPPQLGAPATPGAVSGTYGGSYINPVTGQIVYASNANMPSSTQMYNQDLMSRLMGYGGGGQDLTRQIAAQQGTLDRLKSQGAGAVKLTDYVDPAWVSKDDPNKVINWQDYINKRGADNPLWDLFMGSTNGNYGSKNPDISFSNWAKDTYNKFLAPKLESYKKAADVAKGNEAVYNQQYADEQQKLATLQDYQTQMGSASEAASKNPILSYLNNGPDQSNYLQHQMTQQYKNAELANQQSMAKRGMGSSAMSEIGGAGNRLGLAQGIAGAQIQAGQQNYNNRLSMLGYLSGQNAQNVQTELGRGGLNNSQMGMGQGVGQNMASATTNQQAANQGMGWQGQMAGFNANQAQGIANQNVWGSAANALGANANNISNWLKNQRGIA